MVNYAAPSIYPPINGLDGIALSGGQVYYGVAGSDPQTTPIAVFWDSAGTIAATQPLTTIGGYITRNGSPATPFVAGAYSIRVLNAYGAVVYYIADSSTQDVNASFRAVLALSSGSSLIGFKQSNDSGFLTGATARTVNQKLQEALSVKDFGAIGDSATNNYAAFVAANATGLKIKVPSGNYLIGASLTISSQIEFDAGATLLIGNGVTVAFTGQVISGPYRIFTTTGTGEVTFDWVKTSTGYPEWWGAQTGGADCLTAIHSCLKAVKITFLQPADYFVSDTVRIIYDHRWLVGSGSSYSGVNNQVTRLLVTNGSNYTLQVGPDVKPSAINDFQKQNVIKDIYVTRSVVPVILSQCAGVNFQYTLSAEAHRVQSAEHILGYRFHGNVYLKCYDCFSVRATAGSGGGTDTWYGYYYDGTAIIGAAGGNASVYTNYCSAGCNIASLQTGVSYGYYVNSAFTDLFFEGIESVSCNVGMYVGGDAPSGTEASNTDLQIKNPTHDSFKSIGTHIKNINKYGSAALIHGYHGPGSLATHCILMEDCVGAVSIVGGQFPMIAAPSATGIGIDGCRGAVVDRVQLLEATQYGVVLLNSTNCDIRPIVKNFSKSLLHGAVVLITSERNTVAPIVYGAAGYAARGISAEGSANLYNEFNCTGIDSASVGGSANKLFINGASVAVTGLSGTNLVSGVMA